MQGNYAETYYRYPKKYKHILFELEKEYTGKLKLLIFYQR